MLKYLFFEKKKRKANNSLLGFVGFDISTLGDMSVSSTGTEAALAVRALDVVGRVGRRRRRQVADFAAIFQMFRYGLGGADRLQERLVLLAPVRLL